MKRVIIVGVVFIQLCGTVLMASDNSSEHEKEHEERRASVIKVPLQNELTKVFDSSEDGGKKVGKKTKKMLCNELHWQFFCKGGSR
jgi:uncharacterized glyoxalase superfamily protein PhnB